MKTKQLSKNLGIPLNNTRGIDSYIELRNYFLNRYKNRMSGNFQSPSINPTTHRQRSLIQNDKEYSVYQRADFTPLKMERKINSYFPRLSSILPRTVLFNSGMGAISTLIFHLNKVTYGGKFLLAKNAYFETKWILENYKLDSFNEYEGNLKKDFDILWLEYPINCTQPQKYPFEKTLNLKEIIKNVIKACAKNPKKEKYLVIDYTLYFLPLDLTKIIKKIPRNLSIFLVTSLQKHRGYGLDLTNGGALTYYGKSDSYFEDFQKLRAILGTCITQETIWLMPDIKPKLINKIIADSGKNAKNIYNHIKKIDSNNIKIYFSNNEEFLTSFIFLTINKKLVSKWKGKKFISDLLVEHIIKEAKKRNALIVNGTSFGLPYTRIFKNSERYHNADSLRIAVGYDEDMNENVAEAIYRGITNFINKYEK